MKSSLKILVVLGCVAAIVCGLGQPSLAAGHGGGGSGGGYRGGGYSGGGYHGGGYGYHGGGYCGYGYRGGWGCGFCCTPWPFVYSPYYGPVYGTGYYDDPAPMAYQQPAYAVAQPVDPPVAAAPVPAAPVANPTAAVGVADPSGAPMATTTVYDAPQGAYVAQQPAPAPAPVYVQQPGRTTVYVSSPPAYAAPATYYYRPVYYYRPTYYTYAAPYYYRPGVAVIVR